MNRLVYWGRHFSSSRGYMSAHFHTTSPRTLVEMHSADALHLIEQLTRMPNFDRLHLHEALKWSGLQWFLRWREAAPPLGFSFHVEASDSIDVNLYKKLLSAGVDTLHVHLTEENSVYLRSFKYYEIPNVYVHTCIRSDPQFLNQIDDVNAKLRNLFGDALKFHEVWFDPSKSAQGRFYLDYAFMCKSVFEGLGAECEFRAHSHRPLQARCWTGACTVHIDPKGMMYPCRYLYDALMTAYGNAFTPERTLQDHWNMWAHTCLDRSSCPACLHRCMDDTDTINRLGDQSFGTTFME